MFIESVPLGVRGKGFQGESFFTTPNPKPGVVVSYYLKEDIKTLKEKRKLTEKEKIKKGEQPFYISIDSLRLEDAQPAAHLLFVIRDEAGNTVRKIKAPAKKGVQRINWDFRYAPFGPIDLTPFDESFVFGGQEKGYMALPGNYTISMNKFEDGVYTELVAGQPFKTITLNNASLAAGDKKAVEGFSKKIAELRRATLATENYRAELLNRLKYIKAAIIETPALPLSISKDVYEIEKQLNDMGTLLNGDATLSKREFETTPSINDRVESITSALWNSTAGVTETFVKSYELAADNFAPVIARLKLVSEATRKVEAELEKNGAPYTPGRLPEWKKD